MDIYLKNQKQRIRYEPSHFATSVTEQLKRYRVLENKQKLRLGDQWNRHGRNLLFSASDGSPIHPSSISGYWSKKLKAFGLPQITFQDLRHTSATLLINQGVHMKTISAK